MQPKALPVFAILTLTSCYQALGLGDYKDVDAGAIGGSTASATSTSSSTGQPPGCTTVADCPTGDHGTSSCDAGVCHFACDSGRLDCDSVLGCETDGTQDLNHCGACGTTCSVACVASSCNDPKSILAFYNSTCGILADGSVWCWGFNHEGELGLGDKVDRTTPFRVQLPLPATALAGSGLFLTTSAYSAHACAILANASLWCWGSNDNGELGLSTLTSQPTPQEVGLSDVAEISAGGATACAIKTNGDLYCWGSNDQGGVGIGGPTQVAIPTPTKVAGSWKHVAVGGVHTCGIDSSQGLHCWGGNGNGQLGTGSPSDLTAPGASVVTQFGPLTDVLEVRSGKHYACARNAVGTYCWGENTAGRLGIGSLTQQTVAQPLTLPGATQLATGDYHAGAILSQPVPGSLLMWGEDADGQLGDGTAIRSPSPKLINWPDVTTLSLGERHSCAISSKGAACWGFNGYGQLGDGTQMGSSTPVPVKWSFP